MKTAIDWNTHREPWRTFGIKWAEFCHYERLLWESRHPEAKVVAMDGMIDQAGADVLGRRLNAKLTQRQLAEKAHVSQQRISQVEHAQGNLSREAWGRIDAALSQDGPTVTRGEA